MSDFTVGNQTPGKVKACKIYFFQLIENKPAVGTWQPSAFYRNKKIFRISKIIAFCKKLQKWGPGAPPAGLQAPGALPGALQAPPPSWFRFFDEFL